MTNALINNIYPPSYWNLKGVQGMEPPSELWWSSRERKAFEDGLPTSEYLELDFGRLRSFNFLNMNVMMKPINITVEYDTWGFDSGVKFWQSVTRIPGERFDNSVSFTPNSANPWKNCQYYFTNLKGDMVSARYLRIKFDRRDEPWPNGDLANTFPWSVDVKDLRTARYVITLNDTRGVLVNQGKVVKLIVDPVKYLDGDGDPITMEAAPSAVEVFSGLDAGTVTMVGEPSGVEPVFYTDAATITEVSEVSGVEDYIPPIVYTDADTVSEVAVVSGDEEFYKFSATQLVNPGAETDLSWWTLNGGTVPAFKRTTQANTFTAGVAGFRYDHPGIAYGTIQIYSNVWGGPGFTAGKTYRLFFDMEQISIIPAPIPQLLAGPSYGSILPYTQVTSTVLSFWTRYQWTWVQPTTDVPLFIWTIPSQSPSGQGSMFWDNIRLFELVP